MPDVGIKQKKAYSNNKKKIMIIIMNKGEKRKCNKKY